MFKLTLEVFIRLNCQVLILRTGSTGDLTGFMK